MNLNRLNLSSATQRLLLNQVSEISAIATQTEGYPLALIGMTFREVPEEAPRTNDGRLPIRLRMERETQTGVVGENAELGTIEAIIQSHMSSQQITLGNETRTISVKDLIARYETRNGSGKISSNSAEITNRESEVEKAIQALHTSILERQQTVIKEKNEEISILVKQIKVAKGRLEELEELNIVLTTNVQQQKKLLEKTVQEKDALKTELEEKEYELEGAHRSLLQAKSDIQAGDRIILDLKQEITELEGQVEGFKKEVSNLKSEIKENAAKLEKTLAQLNKLKDQLREKEVELGDSLANARKLQDKIDEKKEALEAKKEALAAKEKKIEHLTSENIELKSQLDQLERENARLKFQFDSLEEDVAHKQRNVEDLKTRLQQARDDFFVEQRKNMDLEAGLGDKKRRLDRLKTRYDQLSSLSQTERAARAKEIADLEEEKKLAAEDFEQALHQYEEAKNALANRTRKVKELEGLIGDAQTDYNALEDQVKHLVGDIAEKANQIKKLTKALDHTKELNHEIAKALDKKDEELAQIKSQLKDTRSQLNQVKGNLEDLGVEKQRAQNRVRDLEANLGEAEKTHRELQRQLNEVSKNNAANKAEKEGLQAELKEINKEKAALEQKLQQAKEELAKAREKIADLTEQLNLKESQLQKLQNQFDDTVRDLNAQNKKLREEKASLETEYNAKLDLLEKNQEELSKLQRKKNKNKQIIQNLEDELARKTTELETANRFLDDQADVHDGTAKRLKSQIDELTAEIANLRAKLNAAAANSADTEDTIKALKNDLQTTETQLAKLSEELQYKKGLLNEQSEQLLAQEEELFKQQQLVLDLQNRLGEAERDRDTLRAELRTRITQQTKSDQQIQDLERQIDDSSQKDEATEIERRSAAALVSYLRHKLAQLYKERDNNLQKIRNLEKSLLNNQDTINDLNAQLGANEELLGKATHRAKSAEKEVARLGETLGQDKVDSERALARITFERDKAKEKLALVEAQSTHVQSQLNAKEEEVQEKQRKLHQQQIDLANAQGMASRTGEENKTLKELIKQKDAELESLKKISKMPPEKLAAFNKPVALDSPKPHRSAVAVTFRSEAQLFEITLPSSMTAAEKGELGQAVISMQSMISLTSDQAAAAIPGIKRKYSDAVEKLRQSSHPVDSQDHRALQRAVIDLGIQLTTTQAVVSSEVAKKSFEGSKSTSAMRKIEAKENAREAMDNAEGNTRDLEYIKGIAVSLGLTALADLLGKMQFVSKDVADALRELALGRPIMTVGFGQGSWLSSGEVQAASASPNFLANMDRILKGLGKKLGIEEAKLSTRSRFAYQ